MQKISLFTALMISLSLTLSPHLSYAAHSQLALNNQSELILYSAKKRAHYYVLEVGLKNNSSKKIKNPIKKIFIEDHRGVAYAPLKPDELNQIVHHHPRHYSNIPLGLSLILGIGSIASHRHPKASRGLGIAAASLGGTFILSRALEQEQRHNRFVQIKGNKIQNTQDILPKMTLGGFLYFPLVSKPRSVIIYTSLDKIPTRINLKGVKKPRKSKSKYSL